MQLRARTGTYLKKKVLQVNYNTEPKITAECIGGLIEEIFEQKPKLAENGKLQKL